MTLPRRALIGTCVVEWIADPSALATIDLLGLFEAAPSAAATTLRWTAEPVERVPSVGPPVAHFGAIRAHIVDDGVLRLDGPAGAAIVTSGQVSIDTTRTTLREGRTLAGVALGLALRTQGHFHVHAGLVQLGRSGILVPGESGGGKTTTTLHLLSLAQSRWSSDDSVLVDASGAHAYGIPRPFHVTGQTLRTAPALDAFVRGPAFEAGEPKVLVAAFDAFPGRHIGRVDVTTLMFPEIGPGPTEVRSIEPSEAFARLTGPAALGLVPGLPGREGQLEALGGLIRRAQLVKLHLGPDALADRGQAVRCLERWGGGCG